MRRVRRVLTSLSALALVVFGAVALPASPALAGTGTVPAGVTINSEAPNWDLTVDCNVFTFGTESFSVPGRLSDTMTVHTLNCAGYIYDLTADYDYRNNHPAGFNATASSAEWGASPLVPDIWRAMPIPSTFTLTPGALFYFNDPDYNYYKAVEFDATPEVDDPSGTLAYSQTGSLTADSPHFDAVGGGFFHYLNNNTNCRMVEGPHPYATFDVDITQAGDYTFRFVDASPVPSSINSWMRYNPVGDTLLAVYTDFDPANPEANVVDCNDEGRLYPDQVLYSSTSGQIMTVNYPSFTATLDPAVASHYTLVMTTYNQYDANLWNTYSYGTGVGTYEMWGPQDGFVIPAGAILPGSNRDNSGGADASSGAALPDTGLNLLRLGLTSAALFGMGAFVYLLRAGLIQAAARAARRSTFTPLATHTAKLLRRGRR